MNGARKLLIKVDPLPRRPLAVQEVYLEQL